MRLFEMDERPTSFGKAKIEYANQSEPSREGNTIAIPEHNYSELFPLAHRGKHDQFLLVMRSAGEHGTWFGGTDENPFLVRIDNAPLNEFLKLGEGAFYQSLIQQGIFDLSLAVHRNYVRQGDIFAVPLNMSWFTLCRCFRVARWGDARSNYEVHDVDKQPVFGTRHLLTGTAMVGPYLYIHGVNVETVASGVVEAPDHSPLNLGGMPHALFQTNHLSSPRNAD